MILCCKATEASAVGEASDEADAAPPKRLPIHSPGISPDEMVLFTDEARAVVDRGAEAPEAGSALSAAAPRSSGESSGAAPPEVPMSPVVEAPPRCDAAVNTDEVIVSNPSHLAGVPRVASPLGEDISTNDEKSLGASISKAAQVGGAETSDDEPASPLRRLRTMHGGLVGEVLIALALLILLILLIIFALL
mmetsp:Transcript_16746/g.36738  ORF Transcript_16746/g.36738 Transcript_16746/m.36738 type:complete len:192 (+) Transcript_16746:98-673(+)